MGGSWLMRFRAKVICIPIVLCLTGCRQRKVPVTSGRMHEHKHAASSPLEKEPKIKPTEIIDSNMRLDEALIGQDIPQGIVKNLAIVDIEYWSFDGRDHKGQLVVRKDLTEEVKAIFMDIKAAHFPIEKMVPVVKYAWSDADSMADDNSSAFNYRKIQDGHELSKHAYGLAIDINPRLNPYVKKGITLPHGAHHSPEVLGTIIGDGIVVKAFRKRGWKWGGDWHRLKDWQHFEKAN